MLWWIQDSHCVCAPGVVGPAVACTDVGRQSEVFWDPGQEVSVA